MPAGAGAGLPDSLAQSWRRLVASCLELHREVRSLREMLGRGELGEATTRSPGDPWAEGEMVAACPILDAEAGPTLAEAERGLSQAVRFVDALDREIHRTLDSLAAMEVPRPRRPADGHSAQQHQELLQRLEGLAARLQRVADEFALWEKGPGSENAHGQERQS